MGIQLLLVVLETVIHARLRVQMARSAQIFFVFWISIFNLKCMDQFYYYPLWTYYMLLLQLTCGNPTSNTMHIILLKHKLYTTV